MTFFVWLLTVSGSLAHPMPNSVVLLTVHPHRIEAEIQIPLNELQAAYGHAVNDSSDGLAARLGPQLTDYIRQHIHPTSPDGRAWTVSVGELAVQQTQNQINGTYGELVARAQLTPPTGADVRHFVFAYDVVIHQVVTHKILVSIRQDWEQGVLDQETTTEVGVIALDIPSNTIPPLRVDLKEGSTWLGFRSMISLGMEHISEGTDHLLFLLVLLLPAPLLVNGRRWGRFGGVRYSLIRLLQIVTAFTLGHSLTLLAGALGWVRLPAQPVEVLIAVSILVSALHALRPLFPGREAWIAGGFGLIHGLAFASTLANLQLDAGPMVLSILGFNLGIECMQLVIIGLTIPWLILLSQTAVYRVLQPLGALLATVAALAWVAERVTGNSNPLTRAIEQLASLAPWLVGILAMLAIISWWFGKKQPTVS